VEPFYVCYSSDKLSILVVMSSAGGFTRLS
jgi:hypothetical protein